MDTYNNIGQAAECVQRINDEGKGELVASLSFDRSGVSFAIYHGYDTVVRIKAPCHSSAFTHFVKDATGKALADLEAQDASVEPDSGKEVEA